MSVIDFLSIDMFVLQSRKLIMQWINAPAYVMRKLDFYFLTYIGLSVSWIKMIAWFPYNLQELIS